MVSGLVKPDPAARMLLIVDMLNGFLAPWGSLYCGRSARQIIPYVVRKSRRYRRAGWPVVFLCDSHRKHDPEFDHWPAHCVRGTNEAKIIPELAQGDVTIVRKTTLSAFYNTRLTATLRQYRPQLVELAGVYTDICILLTAAELGVRGYRVRVLSRGVASYSRAGHKHALELMQRCFAAEVA